MIKGQLDGTTKDEVSATLAASDILMPIDMQSRLATTVQTHNAVSIALSSSILSSNVDCMGYDKLAVTLLNDASTACSVELEWSNDGVTNHGFEIVVASAASPRRAGITDIKARYVKLRAVNGDAAIAHVMSVWAYLKA